MYRQVREKGGEGRINEHKLVSDGFQRGNKKEFEQEKNAVPS